MKVVNDYAKGKIELDPGNFKGSLHESGKASWTCDTIPVWARGKEMDFQEIIDSWKEQGIYENICNGLIHIIWTGGEPTIRGHQLSIARFIEYWENLDTTISKLIYFDGWTRNYFNEIETNGTIFIDDALFELLDQINCSPKLSNSGMASKYRIIPDAIERIMSHHNYQMKFVVSTEDDIFEMFDTYINPFKIPLKNVVCMPGLDSREDFHERTRWVLEMAKKYNFIGLTRLHVSAWDKTTGV
jgi:organic radical activating enzyme